MLIIPAIDLKDGQVVRYTKGRYKKTVYSSNPVSVARDFAKKGAGLLHVVDLDGALFNNPKNFDIICKIIKKACIPIEVSGGIRDSKAVDKFIRAGAARIVLGTKAVCDPEFLKQEVKKYGEKIACCLDMQGLKIGVFGWRRLSNASFKGIISKFQNLGLKTLIFTDISRDGTLSGINIKLIKKILAGTRMKIIASGGVSSLDDIIKLKNLKSKNLAGVIVGKALYEKRFSLEDALRLLNS